MLHPVSGNNDGNIAIMDVSRTKIAGVGDVRPWHVRRPLAVDLFPCLSGEQNKSGRVDTPGPGGRRRTEGAGPCLVPIENEELAATLADGPGSRLGGRDTHPVVEHGQPLSPV